MILQKENPAVSVIVPIYNVEKYLAECVDSILGQTFQDMEIILVDDGSLDSSGQMADDYAVQDQRVKVIHKENGGLSSARNAGMKIACGEYIYFCDSDDYISLDAMEILYETATKNDLDMVLFNADSFLDKDDTKNKALKRKVEWYKRYYERKVDYGGGIKKGTELFAEMSASNEYRASVCFQFIKREYCEGKHLRFYEGIIYEDNLYSLEALLLASRVMFVHKTLFHRRVRAGSTMTSSETFKNFYSYFVVYREVVYFFSRYKFENSVIEEATKIINERYKRGVLRIWEKLTESEKEGFRGKLPTWQRILFDGMVGNGEIENKSRKLAKELYDIRHGYSFRIGRMVTWFPRKLRGGIHCVRQHGAVYTAKRVLEHFGVDMGTGDFGRRK